jgi:hypothetical protein
MRAQRQSGRSSTLVAGPQARCYRLYGMRILSEVLLPIPELSMEDAATYDWVVRRGAPADSPALPRVQPLAEDRAPDGTVLDRFYRHGDDAWLWDYRVGLIHLKASAGRVVVYPPPDVDEDDLGLVLIGPVFSFMLHRSGLPNLHASAVVTSFGACAFVGPSTLGKSTLAAGLLRTGARFLTDDILPLRFGRDGVFGVPGPAMMKLWPATAQCTLGIADRLPSLTSYTDKRLLALHRHQYACEERPTRLRAIYVPQRFDPEAAGHADPVVERLGMREAVLVLLSQTFRGHYLYPQELASLLVQLRRLVSQVSVATLRIPHGLEYQNAVTAQIVEDLASL